MNYCHQVWEDCRKFSTNNESKFFQLYLKKINYNEIKFLKKTNTAFLTSTFQLKIVIKYFWRLHDLQLYIYYYHKIYIFEICFNFILSWPGLNKLNRLASGAQNLWDAPDFSNAHISPRKKEKPFDLQVFSRIGEIMKKLQWILNTIMNNSVFVIF